MKQFEQHEQFEIEVLEFLKNRYLLQPLVFGGGTMLRLCHEINRYSVDLDFWIIKMVDENLYFDKFQTQLSKSYQLTDKQNKFHTFLFELKSAVYPRKLKIEIRKESNNIDFQERIAWSRFSAKQVLLKTMTLAQMMQNKLKALIERDEIRDAFDIEFLLRKGIPLPRLDEKVKKNILNKINAFSIQDFKVKLGSIIHSDLRQYYIENGFVLLQQKIADQK